MVGFGRFKISPAFGSAAGAFGALSGWCLLYLVLCARGPRRRAEWHCRVVTVVHAVLVCSLSAYACLVEGPWPFTDPGGASTPLQHFAVIICLGYFLFDFAWCLTFNTEGPVMLIHHACTILGLTVTMFRGMYGTEMMAAMFGTEVTNPLLQLRWFLRETGQKHSRAARITDVFFVLLFGTFRILLGSLLLYIYLRHPTPDIIGKIGGTGLYVIGWVFWLQICAYSYRKLTQPSQPSSAKDSVISNGHSNGEVDHLNNCVKGAKVVKND